MLVGVRRGALLLCLIAVLGLSSASTAAAAVPTGNLLVLLRQDSGRTASDGAAVQAEILALGGRPAGRSVSQIGLVTVHPPPGVAAHPDFAGKLAATVNQQAATDSTGPADTDQVGHGTHVASLACAATDNGLGIAGAGYGCRLVIEKTDFTDSSIAAAIIDATK